MQQLEAFYESTPKAVGFIERKISIPSHTLNLYGPPQSGKTWLVLDYLGRIPKRRRLYIDLADLRVDRPALAREIQGFVDAHRIETVVIDHYDGTFPMPVCRQCILVTQSPWRENAMMPLLELPPLDFEEYLAFERRPIHLEHSFSLYLRTGRLPAMATVHESLLTLRLHERIRSIFPTPAERTLFRYLARFLGKPVTANQLYTTIRKTDRISKDWLYGTLKSWEARGIVTWFEKYGQPRAARRLLIYDFAMPASMYFEKSLMGQLYSIAALRLLADSPETVYTDKIDFFDPPARHALLLSPFANPQSAAAKVAKLVDELDRLSVGKITILTIANAFEFMFEEIPVEAKPFYEWILGE
jgi:predicted AAA+ superfamily ATPase